MLENPIPQQFNGKVKWIRGADSITFNRPSTWFTLGIRGCLPLNEKVITIHGTCIIEDFVSKGGDLVLSDKDGIIEYNVGLPFFSGYKQIYKVLTDKGSFQASAEQPFKTDLGWKQLSELRENDKLFILAPKLNLVDSFDNSNLCSVQETIQCLPVTDSKNLFTQMPFEIGESTNARNKKQNQFYFKEVLPRASRSYRNYKKEVYWEKTNSRDAYKEKPRYVATFQGSPTEKERNYDKLYLVWKANLCLPFSNGRRRKEDVLFKQLQNKMEEQIPQSREIRNNQNEKFSKRKGKILSKNTRRERNNQKTFSSFNREKQECSNKLGTNTQKRMFKNTEKIFPNTSREASERKVTEKSNDYIRETNRISIEGYGANPIMEQGNTSRRRVEIPRFSDCRYEHFDRMQRDLLAQPRRNKCTEGIVQELRLQPGNIRREFNQTRNKSNYERATILSVTSEGIKPTYDLHVRRAHNFFLANGILTHNSGKSSFLEAIGENYIVGGSTILDLFGSKDGEGLAWLRSPYAKDKKILLLHGENVDVESSFDAKTVQKLELGDFEKYDIVVSSNPLYSSIDDEFSQAASITDLIYKRLYWKRLVYCIVREASNMFYSRLKVSDSQTESKAQMTYLIREGRHCGLALGLDSLKWTSVDIDIRSLSDYLILKSQGLSGLSRDLSWIYGLILPRSLQNMKPQHFVMLTRRGALGIGSFKEISWHKREGENILDAIGIKVEYGEEINYGVDKGTYKTISDHEHAKIINLYVEENLGMHKIADTLGRGTGAVKDHIDTHNNSMIKTGFCRICNRVGSKNSSILASRVKKLEP